MIIDEQLKIALIKRNKSQKDLARLLTWSPGYISQISTGKPVSDVQAERLAEALDYSLEEFLKIT